MNEQDEPFMDLKSVAAALGENRRYVNYLARTGVIRWYPMSGRRRIIRKFRLSEVKHDLVGRRRKIRKTTKKVNGE
jgi:hypothetical protein